MSIRAKYLLLVAVTALPTLTTGQGCSDSHPTSSEKAEKDRLVEFSPVIHTIPPMLSDEVRCLEHEFPVVNSTKKPVRIRELNPSCSCAAATIDAMDLNPGERTRLHIKLDLTGRDGAFAAHCLVVNDTGQPWLYKLQTHVYKRIEFSPAVLRLDAVRPGKEVMRDVLLFTYGHKAPPPAPHLSVVPGSEAKVSFTTGQSTVENVSDGILRSRTPLCVKVTPPHTAGAGLCELAAQLSGTEAQPVVMRMEWFVDDPYVISPTRAFFGFIGSTKLPQDRSITIRRRDNQPFRVVNAQSTCTDVECSSKRNMSAAREHVIELTLKGNGFDHFTYGEVLIVTDDPAQLKIKVPFAASR